MINDITTNMAHKRYYYVTFTKTKEVQLRCRFWILLSLSLCFYTDVWAINFFSSGNPSNDKLLAMSESDQSATLSKATQNNCKAKDPYYMGTEKKGVNKDVSFWSIACENTSKKYLIIVAPNAIGSTKVIECKLLTGMPWKCGEKLQY